MLNGDEGWEIPCQPCLNSSINFVIGIVTSRDQRIQNKANHDGNPGFPRHRPLRGPAPDAAHRTGSLALFPGGREYWRQQKRRNQFRTMVQSAIINWGLSWRQKGLAKWDG
jgi:hypothetical protein